MKRNKEIFHCLFLCFFFTFADLFDDAPKEKSSSTFTGKKNKKKNQKNSKKTSFKIQKVKKKSIETFKKTIPPPPSSSPAPEKTTRGTPSTHILNSVLPVRSVDVIHGVDLTEREQDQDQDQDQDRDQEIRRVQTQTLKNQKSKPVSCLPPLIKSIKKNVKRKVKQNSFQAAEYLKRIMESILRDALEKKANSLP